MQANELAVRIPSDLIPRPVLMRYLDEPDVALGETPSHQTLPAEIARLRTIQTVQPLRCLALLRDIERLRRLGLHSKSQLERLNAGLELGVMAPAVCAPTIHL